jgi:osmotically-inducible protein OsmY
LDDAALATRVREVLSADAMLAPYRITVDARRGAVTLTGTVPNESLRDRATMIVTSVPEVGHVENLMSIQ